MDNAVMLLHTEQRKTLVTASEVPIILGLSKFMDRQELLLQRAADVARTEESPKQKWGNDEEPNMARIVSSILGAPVSLSKAFFIEPGNRLGATPDALIEAPGPLDYAQMAWRCSSMRIADKFQDDYKLVKGPGVVELKLTGWKLSELGPLIDSYRWQVQTQLLCTGREWGVLAMRINAFELRCFMEFADSRKQDRIVVEAEKFLSELEGLRNELE